MAVNATAYARYLPPNDPDHVEGVTILSMANITSDDKVRFWTHIIQIIWNTIGCCYLLSRMWKDFLNYKRIEGQRRHIHNYTVCITQVKKTDIGNINNHFEELFPGEIASIQPVYQVGKVLKLKQKRMKYVKALEKTREKEKEKGEEIEVYEAPARCLGCSPLCFCNDKVNATQHYSDKINETEIEIQRQQENYGLPHATSAFITFNSISTARNCAQSHLLIGNAVNAPEPNNVRWENHFARKIHRFIVYWIVNIVIFFLVLFYLIPVGFATALANIEDIAQLEGMSFLRPLLRLTTLVSIINGILPSLVLIIFFILLQLIIYKLLDQAKPISNSKLDTRAFKKMFMFYVINIFLVSILATTFWGIIDQLQEIVTSANFYSVVLLLATSLPTQATFFINYVITAGIAGGTIKMLRIGEIFTRYLHKYTAKTERNKIWSSMPNHNRFWATMAHHLLFFLIIVTYSTIAPIILFFGVLYFGIVVFSTSYSFTYITRQYYDGYGEMFPAIHNRIVVCLLVYQLTLCGVFIINVFTEGAVISAVCFIGTVLYLFYENRRMRSLTKFGYYNDWVKCEPLPEDKGNAYLTPTLWDASIDLNDIHQLGKEKELRRRMNKE